MTREARIKLLESASIVSGWVLLTKEEAEAIKDWVEEAKQSLSTAATLLYQHLPCTCKTHTGLFGGQSFCEACSITRDLKALATEPVIVPTDPLPMTDPLSLTADTQESPCEQGSLFDPPECPQSTPKEPPLFYE
jgi:hypothetical protein